MGWFKRAFGFSSKPITKAASFLNPNAYIGNTFTTSMASGEGLKQSAANAGAPYGAGMSSDEMAQMEKDAKEAAAAALRQQEYEEQAAKGRARVSATRRRGFSSTMLTGGPTALTLGGGSSGKTLLGA